MLVECEERFPTDDTSEGNPRWADPLSWPSPAQRAVGCPFKSTRGITRHARTDCKAIDHVGWNLDAVEAECVVILSIVTSRNNERHTHPFREGIKFCSPTIWLSVVLNRPVRPQAQVD
jgi:hypothetical protein